MSAQVRLVRYCNLLPAIQVLNINLHLSHLLGEPVAVEGATGLGGPNEMVQILLDAAPWLAIAALGKPFLESMLKEAGADAWKAIKRQFRGDIPNTTGQRLPSVTNIYLEATKVREAGCAVVLCLPVPRSAYNGELAFKGRAIGIELNPVTPEAFIQAAVILANIANDVEAALSGADGYLSAVEENSDCSCAIKVGHDGSATVSFFVGTKPGGREQVVTLKYDARGNPA